MAERMIQRGDGTVFPSDEYREMFARDLHEAIFQQVMQGRTRIFKMTEGLSIRLPSDKQILNFVTIRTTEIAHEFVVLMSIPSEQDASWYLSTEFICVLPEQTQKTEAGSQYELQPESSVNR